MSNGGLWEAMGQAGTGSKKEGWTRNLGDENCYEWMKQREVREGYLLTDAERERGEWGIERGGENEMKTCNDTKTTAIQFQ